MIQSIWHLIKYSYITLFTYKHGDKAFWFSFIAKTFWQIYSLYSFLSLFLLHQSLKPLPQQFDFVFLTVVVSLRDSKQQVISLSVRTAKLGLFLKISFLHIQLQSLFQEKLKNPNNKQAQTLTSTFSICNCDLLSYREW